MKGIIILITIFIIFTTIVRLILGYSPLSDEEKKEEPWSYESCTYRGDCLTDCCLRDKCPYYSYYKDE